MATKIVSHLLSRLSKLESERIQYETTWDDITEFVLPHRGDFLRKREPGHVRTRRLFDTTAIQANEFLAATLHGGLTPSAAKWFSLRSKDPEVNNFEEAKFFLEIATNGIYDVFNSPSSNFQSNNHELFLDLVAYGTACMYIDDDQGEGITFRAIHLSELFIAEDKSGNIDTVFRKFDFTARQAAQFWGLDKLSSRMARAAEKEPDTKFKIIHCVKPNDDFDKHSRKATKLPFASYYMEKESGHLIDQRGYHEMPYLVTRWAKLVGETYGRSPAWSALADIQMLNTMSKVVIVASEKQIDPPLLMADDGVMMPLQTRPGGVNFGGLDIDGRPRIQPLVTNARLDLGFEMMDQRAKAIRNAYHIDPLLNSPIKSNVTREEILQRQEEKLRLIGPQIGRIESEYLNKTIQRVYGILQRNNQLPELPDEVAQLIEEGGLKVEYSSPLSRTQKSQDPIAFQRWLQLFTPLAQAMPQLFDLINTDRSGRVLAESLGVPLELLNSQEETQEIREQRAQAQQQAQMMQTITEGADTVATLAKSGVLDGDE